MVSEPVALPLAFNDHGASNLFLLLQSMISIETGQTSGKAPVTVSLLLEAHLVGLNIPIERTVELLLANSLELEALGLLKEGVAPTLSHLALAIKLGLMRFLAGFLGGGLLNRIPFVAEK